MDRPLDAYSESHPRKRKTRLETHDVSEAESAALEKSTNVLAEESAPKGFYRKASAYPQYGASALLSPEHGRPMAGRAWLSLDTEDPGDQVRRSRGDPPQAHDGRYYCAFSPECADQYFDRKCEWSKHMDKHDRPYRCPQPQCARLQGFTYSGGLLRHEREVHGRTLQCTVPECKRHSGKGFNRKENLDKHLCRVHGITANSSATAVDDLKPQVPAEDVWNEAQRDAEREASSNAAGNTLITAIQPDAMTDFSWLSQHASSDEYHEQQQDHWGGPRSSHKLQESLQFPQQLPPLLPPIRVKADVSIQTQRLSPRTTVWPRSESSLSSWPRSESSLPSWPRSESRAYTPTTRVTTEQPYTPDFQPQPDYFHSPATYLHAPYQYTHATYTDHSLLYTDQAGYETTRSTYNPQDDVTYRSTVHCKSPKPCTSSSRPLSLTRPMRCTQKACAKEEFFSAACLLRHEREAHGMHGQGDRPHLCFYAGCERGKPGNGFPRRYNLFDHMRRTHDHQEDVVTGNSSPKVSNSNTCLYEKASDSKGKAPSLITTDPDHDVLNAANEDQVLVCCDAGDQPDPSALWSALDTRHGLLESRWTKTQSADELDISARDNGINGHNDNKADIRVENSSAAASPAHSSSSFGDKHGITSLLDTPSREQKPQFELASTNAAPRESATHDDAHIITAISKESVVLSNHHQSTSNGKSHAKDAVLASPRLHRERELKKWDEGTNQDLEDTALEVMGKHGETGWNQFVVNEQNFGTRTIYNEDDYTIPTTLDHHEYQRRAAKTKSVAQEVSSKQDCPQDMDETIEAHSRSNTAPSHLYKADMSGAPDQSPAQSCSINQHSSHMHAFGNIARSGIVSDTVLSGKFSSENFESRGHGTGSWPESCPSTGKSDSDSSVSSEMDYAPGCDPITSQRKAETENLWTTADLFAKAEADLKCLEVGIQLLKECSDTGSDVSRSESDTNVESETLTQLMNSWRDCSDTCYGDHEETEGGSSNRTDTCTNTAFLEGSAHSDSPAHSKRKKRKQPHSSDDDDTRALVTVSEKRLKATSKRFICCFQNGPGRKCSGTDETISEVIKKLSDWHDTHVCDNCWVLKVKDKQSGRFVHPDNEEMCQDYCLSPQCHSASPNIAHRHKFDQRTCGTKTSRVRPGDSEAVFRFIFQLVHPALQEPLIIFTDEHKLHLDAVPRQCRRKPKFEEVTAEANELRQDLEELGRRLKAEVDEKKRLELEVAELKRRTEKHDERVANSEARTRRIIAILGDALRTGKFPDQAGHFSLLERTQEDAPSALKFRTQALLTPTTSNSSPWSTTTPLVDCTSMSAPEQGHSDNPGQASDRDACLQMTSSSGVDISAMLESMYDPCLSGFEFCNS